VSLNRYLITRRKSLVWYPNLAASVLTSLSDAEPALRLAKAGFDYGDLRKPLWLLGLKYIHVSIFVSVEFPDDKLLKTLKDHGQLKSDALRQLYFTEEGFRHIERGGIRFY